MLCLWDFAFLRWWLRIECCFARCLIDYHVSFGWVASLLTFLNFNLTQIAKNPLLKFGIGFNFARIRLPLRHSSFALNSCFHRILENLSFYLLHSLSDFCVRLLFSITDQGIHGNFGWYHGRHHFFSRLNCYLLSEIVRQSSCRRLVADV